MSDPVVNLARPPLAASPDQLGSIQFWDGVALDANRDLRVGGEEEGSGWAARTRALAIVHLAMYDAHVAVEKPVDFQPYLSGLPTPPPGASAPAAVAGAAHAALSALFPALRSLFDAKLAEIGVHGDPGLLFGQQIASAILADPSGPAAGTFAA